MPPKPQPKAKAQPKPLTADQRKRQASNAGQQPSNKRPRRNTKNTKEGEGEEEEEEEEEDNAWPEIEEEIVSKSKGKKGGRASGGTRGQVKKVPARRYVLISIIISQQHFPYMFLQKNCPGPKQGGCCGRNPLRFRTNKVSICFLRFLFCFVLFLEFLLINLCFW